MKKAMQSSAKYQALCWGGESAFLKGLQAKDTHCEDARMSPAASVCATFHHVADRVLKAWYSTVSKRENNQPLLPGGKQKHSAPAFCTKGMGRKHRESWPLSHTRDTLRGRSDSGVVSHAGNMGKISSKRNNGYKVWHSYGQKPS